MKNKIMSVVAFFIVMAVMTEIAAAYDATVTDHTGTVAATDVFVFPGQQFHWHFQATRISSFVVGTEVDYGLPMKFATPSSAPLPTVTIVTPNSTFPAPSFVPNASNWIDMDSFSDFPPIGCCVPGNVLTTPNDHPDRIIITMDPNSPPGAIYRITIPTTAKNGLDQGAASRNVIIINTSTTLTKTANPTTLTLTPGGSGTVTYTITETNTGNVPITDTLSDPDLNAPAASCTPSNLPATFTLAPSASTTYTCTKTYTDAEQGVHTNTVTATAHPIVDNVTVTNVTVNESANATVNVTTVSTTLTKTANPTNLTLSPGGSGTVTYTITETNNGDVPLMTTVSDPGVPGASCTPPLPDTRRYNPGDSVTFTCTKTYTDSEQGVHTNTVTATANPIVDNETLTNLTFNESASATVNITTTNVSCPSGECKFKTWGLLGNVANPEKKFEMLFFSPIPNGGPQGSMTVEDNNLHMTIESTQVTSIVTSIPAGTGTATGRAHVTGGPHPGDYDFTVNVVDAAHSGTPRGTFEIILQSFPGGYDNKGNLTFGVISIIK